MIDHHRSVTGCAMENLDDAPEKQIQYPYQWL
jgi:hypothetical protein